MISRQDLETVLNTAGIPRVDTMKICHAYDKMIGEQTPPQFQGKTVEVRVAVAVSSNSEWNAAGWYDGKHDVVVETAMDSAHFPATIFWLTATLPVPAEVEVVAKAEGE